VSTETEEHRDARKAGARYGLRLAEELSPLIIKAEAEDVIMSYIKEMAQEIEQHARELAERGLGYKLAGIWMRAAGKAAMARLDALVDQLQQSEP
jgi:thermostable 8-oxoguanine DNA glycosylase